jgi:hypothetical protein
MGHQPVTDTLTRELRSRTQGHGTRPSAIGGELLGRDEARLPTRLSAEQRQWRTEKPKVDDDL